ncbi:MAG: DNA-3-methyladenine glycosylase 2 family protein [Frankiaceae bacterium]
MSSLPLRTVYRPARPLDLVATLGPLRRGTGDPCQRLAADGTLWRTFRTPAGPGTLALQRAAAGPVAATAWGAGAEWLLDALPDLLGAGDDDADFVPGPRLRDAARRHAGVRVPRCRLVLEMVVPAVLEQKVTGEQARQAWRYLLRRYGSPAPGPAPAGMLVFPPPQVWRRVPSWEWHRAGVDPDRSRAVLTAAGVAGRLEETAGMGMEAARQRLRAVPGIGAWTVAEVMQRAHGDADAVSVGDFHLAAQVGWALAARPVDDAGMLELLKPWRGQRYRAVRLLLLSSPRKPRFGPRYAPQDLRAC